MAEKQRYTYRLRVTPSTERWLLEEWNRSRWVWNECLNLARRNSALPKDHRQSTSAASLDKRLTEARKNLSWLREGSSVIQQQMVRNFSKTLQRSFAVNSTGKPKHKSKKKDRPSLTLTKRGFSVGPLNDHGNYILRLPGKNKVTVVTSRPLPSEPSSVVVYQKPTGHWYCSFVVSVEVEELPPVDSGIGIDWGIAQTATTTDDSCDMDYQGFSKQEAKALQRLDRALTRRAPKSGQKASRGYRNIKKQRASLFAKISNRRKDFAIKWANDVVNKHDTIAIEDFKSGFVNRNRSFSRKSHDAAIGVMKSTLSQKAQTRGRAVVKVPPAYTTMTCSNCHAIAKRKLDLSVRVFQCEFCSFRLDRDKNAARNILELGYAMLEIPPGGAEPGTGVDGVRLGATSVVPSNLSLESPGL